MGVRERIIYSEDNLYSDIDKLVRENTIFNDELKEEAIAKAEWKCLTKEEALAILEYKWKEQNDIEHNLQRPFYFKMSDVLRVSIPKEKAGLIKYLKCLTLAEKYDWNCIEGDNRLKSNIENIVNKYYKNDKDVQHYYKLLKKQCTAAIFKFIKIWLLAMGGCAILIMLALAL